MLTWSTVCCEFISVIAIILPIGMVIMYRILILEVSMTLVFSGALYNQHHRILMGTFWKRGNKIMDYPVTSLFFLCPDNHLYPHLFCCAYICAVAAFISREKYSFDGEGISSELYNRAYHPPTPPAFLLPADVSTSTTMVLGTTTAIQRVDKCVG